MSKQDPQNCWEFWDCPEKDKKKCPAYISDSGKECWYFASTFCNLKGRGARKCLECDWYKKFHIES